MFGSEINSTRIPLDNCRTLGKKFVLWKNERWSLTLYKPIILFVILRFHRVRQMNNFLKNWFDIYFSFIHNGRFLKKTSNFSFLCNWKRNTGNPWILHFSFAWASRHAEKMDWLNKPVDSDKRKNTPLHKSVVQKGNSDKPKRNWNKSN